MKIIAYHIEGSSMSFCYTHEGCWFDVVAVTNHVGMRDMLITSKGTSCNTAQEVYDIRNTARAAALEQFAEVAE